MAFLKELMVLSCLMVLVSCGNVKLRLQNAAQSTTDPNTAFTADRALDGVETTPAKTREHYTEHQWWTAELTNLAFVDHVKILPVAGHGRVRYVQLKVWLKHPLECTWMLCKSFGNSLTGGGSGLVEASCPNTRAREIKITTDTTMALVLNEVAVYGVVVLQPKVPGFSLPVVYDQNLFNVIKIQRNKVIDSLSYGELYTIRFQVMATGMNTQVKSNIIHFENMIPAVWFTPQGKIEICSQVNGEHLCAETTETFKTGWWITVHVNVRFNSATVGEYPVQFLVNCKQILTGYTSRANLQTFSNVRVLAGIYSQTAQQGFIRNLKVTSSKA